MLFTDDRFFISFIWQMLTFPSGSEVKASACNVGDLGSIPGSGRSPREENATHSGIVAWRNSMDRGAWQATVKMVAELEMPEKLTYTYTCYGHSEKTGLDESWLSWGLCITLKSLERPVICFPPFSGHRSHLESGIHS